MKLTDICVKPKTAPCTSKDPWAGSSNCGSSDTYKTASETKAKASKASPARQNKLSLLQARSTRLIYYAKQFLAASMHWLSKIPVMTTYAIFLNSTDFRLYRFHLLVTAFKFIVLTQVKLIWYTLRPRTNTRLEW
ncbi:hypothetical protein [Paenibacillus beijingensis]|uniref:hypothetical protein n=1 Tax=Paenibacillus beijingensis TaxID=1126833 RepID=UPI0006977FBF|nr:hypothetical protein [Paenibacillus beijingensis]